LSGARNTMRKVRKIAGQSQVEMASINFVADSIIISPMK
jgi:hypothetical protein